MRALAIWSAALVGMLTILIGSLIPAAVLLPPPMGLIDLPASWQVPALLLCAMVSGPRAGVIAAVAYLTLGLGDLQVFQGGGGLNYVQQPGFGYLAGFIPAAWLTGRLAHQEGMGDVIKLTASGIAGLVVLQGCGLLNLVLGGLVSRWDAPLLELIVQYSLGPLPGQLLLCIATAVLAVVLRRILIVEP